MLELAGATYRIVAVHAEEARVRALPFEAVELALQRCTS
jgi:hypothetical protein